MAFRMQTSVPELTDFSSEPDYILDMYGPDVHKPGTFAYCCLMARRLAERGVRFSQIFHRGWDQHGNVTGDFLIKQETLINQQRRSYKILSNEVCWTIRSWFGAGNLVELSTVRGL